MSDFVGVVLVGVLLKRTEANRRSMELFVPWGENQRGGVGIRALVTLR